jgi:hypothetical protein
MDFCGIYLTLDFTVSLRLLLIYFFCLLGDLLLLFTDFDDYYLSLSEFSKI